MGVLGGCHSKSAVGSESPSDLELTYVHCVSTETWMFENVGDYLHRVYKHPQTEACLSVGVGVQ